MSRHCVAHACMQNAARTAPCSPYIDVGSTSRPRAGLKPSRGVVATWPAPPPTALKHHAHRAVGSAAKPSQQCSCTCSGTTGRRACAPTARARRRGAGRSTWSGPNASPTGERRWARSWARWRTRAAHLRAVLGAPLVQGAVVVVEVDEEAAEHAGLVLLALHRRVAAHLHVARRRRHDELVLFPRVDERRRRARARRHRRAVAALPLLRHGGAARRADDRRLPHERRAPLADQLVAAAARRGERRGRRRERRDARRAAAAAATAAAAARGRGAVAAWPRGAQIELAEAELGHPGRHARRRLAPEVELWHPRRRLRSAAAAAAAAAARRSRAVATRARRPQA